MHRFELSKEAQILRSKLNIPSSETQESVIRAKNDEEDKGEMEEEFDQSRPMTTRIYDNDDDQHLFMQYKNMPLLDKDCGNKHMSVEAGLERQSNASIKGKISILNDIESKGSDMLDDQYSMIVKNIEDLEGPGYEFVSP